MVWLIGASIVLFYLYYLLTIEFKMAKLDDDVAQPDTDVHNDLTIWSYEYYLPRVKARKLRAFLRWVGVSAVTMLICFLFAGGGQKVKALVLPTPTPSITPTCTASPSPTATATQTPTALETSTLTPTGTSTGNPTPTQGLYKPGPVQIVVQTRIVKERVNVPVQVTRLVVVTATPVPTQTPWIIYVPASTAEGTSSPTPTLIPSETASPTMTVTPTFTPTETPFVTQTQTPSFIPTETQ